MLINGIWYEYRATPKPAGRLDWHIAARKHQGNLWLNRPWDVVSLMNQKWISGASLSTRSTLPIWLCIQPHYPKPQP